MKSFFLNNTTFSLFRSSIKLNNASHSKRFGVCSYCYGALPKPINLLNELSGKDTTIKRLCTISQNKGCTLVVGTDVELHNVKRLSALVINDGILIDIVDCCFPPPPYTPSRTIKIFTNNDNKFALMLGDDVCSNVLWSKTSKKCNLILTLSPSYSQETEQRIRHLARKYNLPVLLHSPSHSLLITP